MRHYFYTRLSYLLGLNTGLGLIGIPFGPVCLKLRPLKRSDTLGLKTAKAKRARPAARGSAAGERARLEESSASALAVGPYFYTRISYPFGLNVQQTILLTRSVYIEVLTRSG